MRDWDYRRALQELWRRSSYERGLISDPFGDQARAERGLRRMRALLAELDSPQLRVPAAHVAGSKGKGSTANFIAAMAGAAGYRVGLYTSPHLHRFPERIAINGHPVSEQEFAALADRATAAAERIEERDPELGTVSTFELVTAMAFLAFADARCDLNVIEVGLGGRYDATNVLQPQLTVITRIDLEHTAVLGSTYREIAFQKAGILQRDVPCVASPQNAETAGEIARVAADVGAPLLIGERDWSWSGDWREFSADGPWGRWSNLGLGIPGDHQIENACTAIAAVYILDQAGIRIDAAATRIGLHEARWPGRFERIDVDGRPIVLDGAHTPAAARALAAAWRSEIGVQPATVIFGSGADKDLAGVLADLRPITKRLLLTQAASPRAADHGALAAAADLVGLPYRWEPSVRSALEFALAQDNSPVLVTGSLFVAAEAREVLGLAAPDPHWAAAAPTAAHAGQSGNRMVTTESSPVIR